MTDAFLRRAPRRFETMAACQSAASTRPVTDPPSFVLAGVALALARFASPRSHAQDAGSADALHAQDRAMAERLEDYVTIKRSEFRRLAGNQP